jgi:YegS/Rv2252/BmrU family lipid kinase
LNVRLVVNPVAGKRKLRAWKKIEDLLRSRVSLTTFTTRKKGDAFSCSQNIQDVDRIIIAGGDGTVNEVINGLLSSPTGFQEKKTIPLALIPLGTANVLARELNIPDDAEQAVELALTGRPKKISLGRINDRYFSLMAGIGFDGETVLKVKESTKRLSGKGAYILSGLRVFKGYNPPLIRVSILKETFSGFTMVVGNARFYGGEYQVTPNADITEPLLDVCLLKSKSRKKLLRFIFGVLSKRHLQLDDVVYRRTSRIEINSKDTVHVQIDGDYFGTLPVTVQAVKDAVSVVW